jgi:hypothetical protein
MTVKMWSLDITAPEKLVLLAAVEYVGCGDDELVGVRNGWTPEVLAKIAKDTSLPVPRVIELMGKLKGRGIVSEDGLNFHVE